MLTYALRSPSLNVVRETYRSRLRAAAPATLPRSVRIEEAVREAPRAEDVLRLAAPVYAAERGNSAMFVHFDHGSQSLQVMSRAGREGVGEFPADNPATLMQFPLVSRVSVHLPELGRLDRRSLLERAEESAGREVLSASTHLVELYGDQGERSDLYCYSNLLLSLLPLGFRPAGGAVLVTPLGLDKTASFAFGLIYEYRPQGAFPLDSIEEARTLSSLFAYRIVERWTAELFEGKQ